MSFLASKNRLWREDSNPTLEPPAVLNEHLVGKYLGPSQLTSSYYTVSGDPILLAKVEANQEWRSRVLTRSLEGLKNCFEESLLLVAPSQTTSEMLNDTYKIGYIVIPHKMIDYQPILDEVMHKAFLLYHTTVEPRDLIEYDIVRLTRAAQYGHNLTNPDALGAPWAPSGRIIIWETFGEARLEDVFAGLDKYILLVNFEPDFLELAYICIQRACDQVPNTKTAFPELGEESLWKTESSAPGEPIYDYDILIPLSVHFGSRVRRLSHAISGFMERTKFRNLVELLHAVILSGGVSQVAMDAIKYALKDALPHLETWRFKTSIDPAFVPSLGAALLVHNEQVADSN